MAHQRGQRKAHHGRYDLAGEHAIGDAGQLILACLFAVTWIADTFFLEYMTFLNQYVPLWIRIPSGVVLLALAGYLENGYVHRVRRGGRFVHMLMKRPQPSVIRESVFSVVRHPIYLSEILLYLGFLMLSISLATAAVWVVAIGFLHYISRYEERLLLERFGKEYEQYMQEVPMWIPRFWKRGG